jgi:hypothetical protein
MLPISIVEREGFREYINAIDPFFTMPGREKLKTKTLPIKQLNIESRIKSTLDKMKFVNITTDGWSDGTLRGFNGYIAHGIDDDWQMQNRTIAFSYTSGIILKL